MNHLLNWKWVLLTTLARRLGLQATYSGVNPRTGSVAFLLGTTDDAVDSLASQHAVMRAIQRQEANGGLEMATVLPEGKSKH